MARDLESSSSTGRGFGTRGRCSQEESGWAVTWPSGSGLLSRENSLGMRASSSRGGAWGLPMLATLSRAAAHTRRRQFGGVESGGDRDGLGLRCDDARHT
jgi:hypothetical protein